MKNRLGLCRYLLFFFTAGAFFTHCGNETNTQGECSKSNECAQGEYCNLAVHQCEPLGCTPDCGTRVCGPAPNACNGLNACGTCTGNNTCDSEGACQSFCDTKCGTRQCGLTPASCDNPNATCGTCTGNNACDLQGMCQSSCDTLCGARQCGLTPATCDVPAATCGTCATGTCNTTTGMCEGACDTLCGARQCGPTPATCDAPAATCGTCATGTCNTTTGMCEQDTTHDKAGDVCVCETEYSCSVPCSDLENGAGACLITDDLTGTGFCSFECSDYDSTECAADFAGGCCDFVLDAFFCLPADYCIPGTVDYLGKCGTEDTGDCKDGLVCVAFNAVEDNGYCVYTCNCPNPTDEGECPGGACTDSGTCIELENTSSTGRGACSPHGNKSQNALCHMPDQACVAGLTCIDFGDLTGTGNGICSNSCDCDTGTGCVAPAECGIPTVGGGCVCAIPCPGEENTECPNNGAGWQCYDFGDFFNADYYCIPE
jgi:hypothetical protein